MATWKKTYRKINGKRRLVKVKYFPSSGRTLVRIPRHRNYTDRTAR